MCIIKSESKAISDDLVPISRYWFWDTENMHIVGKVPEECGGPGLISVNTDQTYIEFPYNRDNKIRFSNQGPLSNRAGVDFNVPQENVDYEGQKVYSQLGHMITKNDIDNPPTFRMPGETCNLPPEPVNMTKLLGAVKQGFDKRAWKFEFRYLRQYESFSSFDYRLWGYEKGATTIEYLDDFGDPTTKRSEAKTVVFFFGRKVSGGTDPRIELGKAPYNQVFSGTAQNPIIIPGDLTLDNGTVIHITSE